MDLAAWRTLVERDLKGAPASKLARRTDDGLTIQPLYTAEDDALALPAARDRRSAPGWQRWTLQGSADAAALAAILAEEAAAGIDGVLIDVARCGDLDPHALPVPPNLSISFTNDPHEIDGHAWHLAGAGDAFEVTCALAEGVDHLRRGAAIHGFTLAAGTRFFEGIAKLRAFRACWTRVLEASGLPLELRLRVRPAARQWTRYEAHLNLLRNTVAVVAGALGGADQIVSMAHDGLGAGSPTGRRLARNTAALLAEESHLDRVLDPAGGSHFLEALTAALADEAWKRFQSIEARGGLGACRAEVAAEVAAIAAERTRRIATRRQPIVGVSEFAVDGAPAAGPTPFPRDAEPFETLRELSHDLEVVHGTRPTVFLATVGTRHAARTAFVTQLLAAGGLGVVVGAPAAFAGTGLPVACLCGHDEDYAEGALAALEALAGAQLIAMAGAPGEREATLRAAGVRRFIVLGGDAPETLMALLEPFHGR